MHPISPNSNIHLEWYFGLRGTRNCVCDASAALKSQPASPEQLAHLSYPSPPTQEQSCPVDTLRAVRGASRRLGAIQSRITFVDANSFFWNRSITMPKAAAKGKGAGKVEKRRTKKGTF